MINKLIIVFLIILMILKNIEFFTLKNTEFFPFGQLSPLKRNMPLDLRCEPEIPKKHHGPWRQSSIDYYYRPKCLTKFPLY